MNYCLLNEAWDPKFTGIGIEQNQSHMKSNQWCPSDNKKNIEKFTQDDETDKPNYKISYDNDCNKIIDHIRNCSSCRNKINVTSNYRPMILDNLQEIINNNKDVIVLVLAGLFILLFFNLVNNITKD
jgi:hypothetical protein